jgi:hypothetical protein
MRCGIVSGVALTPRLGLHTIAQEHLLANELDRPRKWQFRDGFVEKRDTSNSNRQIGGRQTGEDEPAGIF